MAANISQVNKFIKQVQSVATSQEYKSDGLVIKGEMARGGKGDHGKIIWYANGVRVVKEGFRGRDNDKCADKNQYRKIRRLYIQIMEKQK